MRLKLYFSTSFGQGGSYMLNNKLTNKCLIFIVSACFFISIRAEAEETFQYEAQGTFVSIDRDSSKWNIGAADGIYYFTKIENEEVPIAEVPFIEKAGYLDIWGSYYRVEFDDNGDTADANGPEAGIGLVAAGEDSPAAVSIFYSYGRINYSEDSPTLKIDQKWTFLSLNVGIDFYLQENLIVGLNIDHYEEQDEINFTDGSGSYNFGYNTKNNSPSLHFKHLYRATDKLWLNTEGSISYILWEDNFEKGANKEVSFFEQAYFTRNFSAGVGLTINAGDAEFSEGLTASLPVQWYLTPNLGISAAYSSFRPKSNDAEDENRFRVSLNVRL